MKLEGWFQSYLICVNLGKILGISFSSCKKKLTKVSGGFQDDQCTFEVVVPRCVALKKNQPIKINLEESNRISIFCISPRKKIIKFKTEHYKVQFSSSVHSLLLIELKYLPKRVNRADSRNLKIYI